MKQIAKTVLKGLFIVILFTGGSVALSTTGVKTVSEANAATSNQVYQYLIERGYTILSLEPCSNSKYNWTAQTIRGDRYYTTTIQCNANEVIGNTDVANM